MPKQISGRLNARRVESIKEKGKYADGGGLWFYVSETGYKTFHFRWMRKGKAGEMRLGSLDVLSLAEAREKAQECRKIIADGKDPRVAPKAVDTPTFRECAAEFLLKHKDGWSESHLHYWEQLFRDYVYPVNIGRLTPFQDVPVKEIDTPMIQIVLDRIWMTKALTAAEVRYRIQIVLDYASALDHRSGKNPARWEDHLEHLFPDPEELQKRKHFRALSYELCPAFAADLAVCPDGSARMAAFNLRTILRHGNVRYAEWSWVRWDEGILNIPAVHMKAQKKVDYPNDVFQLPLSNGALAILRRQWEQRRGKFIFPGRNPSKPTSVATLHRLYERMDCDTTTHGLRASFRTWADNRTICETEVKEMALAHALGDKTEEAYSRSDLFEKRRHLMQAWDDYLTTGKEDVVFIGISDPNLLAAILRQAQRLGGQSEADVIPVAAE